MNITKCGNCGGMVVDGSQKYHHVAKCVNYMVEGVDHCVCRECGYRSPMLSMHIKLHGMDDKQYLEKYPSAEIVLRSIVDKISEKKRAKGGYKPVSEKRGAVQCGVCQDWYQPETSQAHRQKCVEVYLDKYVEGKDYVRCPECSLPFMRLGWHLKDVHGWSEDRIEMEKNRGTRFVASDVVEKWREGQDFEASQEKREKTHLDRHGYVNPFSNPVVKVKIEETSQRRYGVSHPMQNEEVFARQFESAQKGPSELERFFGEHVCAQCVYVGYGGRFIRTKTGVNKYGRLVKDMNPDFIILSSNVLESALAASKERRKLDNLKHRSRYVVELLGDYYHSEKVIGVKPEDHEREIVEAYKSAGIECLVLWEKDVMRRWESIRPMVDAWVEKAVRDMDENPIFSRATRSKVDRRKGDLVAGDGSGKLFRSRKQLDKWMLSPINYWKAGMAEGEDYVVCLECGVRVSKVAEHLRKSHGGMTKEEYLGKYLGADMVSGRLSRSVAEAHRGVKHGEG